MQFLSTSALEQRELAKAVEQFRGVTKHQLPPCCEVFALFPFVAHYALVDL